MKLTVLLLIAMLSSCGSSGSANDDAPVDLGQISIGGKADDPLVAFDLVVEPGGTQEFNFEAFGDITVSVNQPADPGGKTTIKIVDPRDFDSITVVETDELGRDGAEPTPSDSPTVTAQSNTRSVHAYQVIVRNVDDDRPTRGQLIIAQPEPTECVSFERPGETFDALARCQVVDNPQLEGESHNEVKWVDVCVGTGTTTDHTGKRIETFGLSGQYGLGDAGSDFETQLASAKGRGPIERPAADVLFARRRASFEVVTEKATLNGPEEEREFREFEYSYRYDTAQNVLELRIKSRAWVWPNWFWDLGATISCEPLD